MAASEMTRSIHLVAYMMTEAVGLQGLYEKTKGGEKEKEQTDEQKRDEKKEREHEDEDQ